MTQGSNPYAPPPPPSGGGNPTYNPYAPPSANLGGSGTPVDQAEAIRNEHLSHEASLRSVGCLYFWSGIFSLAFAAIAAVVLPFMLMAGDGQDDAAASAGVLAVLAVLYGGIGALSIWIGRGLRNLDPKIRLALTILLVFGLLGFPIGTILSLYFLYLLYSEKGKRILTEQYQAVVAQTPHIKYRTPLWVWLVLGLMVLVLVVAVVIGTSGV